MPKTKKTKMVVATTTTTTKQSIFAAATSDPTTASQVVASIANSAAAAAAAAASSNDKNGTTTTTVTFAPPHITTGPSSSSSPSISATSFLSGSKSNKSKRRQNRKNASGNNNSGSGGTASFPFPTSSSDDTNSKIINESTSSSMTQDGKTVFGPPPPPPPSSQSSSNATSGNMTAASFTTPKGIPYSVITNLGPPSSSDGNNKSGNGGSSGNNNGSSSSHNSSASNAMSSVAAAAAAAAFGNIDLVTMAQSEMINFGVSTTTITSSSKKSKRNNDSSTSGSTSSNNNKGSSSSTTAASPSSSDMKSVKDVLQKYVDGVSGSSKKGSHNNPNNNNKNSNNDKDGNKSSSNSGDAGPGSDADNMKALMSMFVEIMGMSNLDDKKSSSSSDSDDSSSNNNNNNNSKNMDSAALNAAREHFTRMTMQNAAMAMSSGNGGSSSSSNQNQHSSSNNNNNSSKSGKNSKGPFPVVSMMFGSGGGSSGNGNNNNNSKNRNKNMPNVIPPPPGGWPPGAAAAAAAALAAASNGAASVTVPIGNGSISLPLSMAHVASSSSNGGHMSDGWMREACRQFINEHNYEDGSDISAVNGSDDEYDDDIIDDEMYSNHNHANNSNSSNNSRYHHVKPAPQDRSSGSELYGNNNKGKQNQSNETTTISEIDQETSDAAAAALLQEEEEKAKRAAKKREKKNRKKEKAKREAAIKAARAAQKKREKNITSWRSRVATACSGGEVHKMDSLISDNPFKDEKQQQIDPDILEELGGDVVSYEEEVTQNMEWVLPSCVAKFRETKPKEVESRAKLGIFVMRMAFHVVFVPRRDGRSALHTACVVGDVSFVKLVAERIVEGDDDTNQLNLLCHNMGWSPLHYAAASGWCDVVEILLANGCEVGIRTDPSLTCYISNEKGVTPKEMLEFIHDQNYANSLDYNKEGMQEILDDKLNGSATDCESYKNTLVDLITRLNDVEINGYRPMEVNKLEIIDQSDESPSLATNVISKKPKNTEGSRKKKKKKKKKNQSNNDDAADESSVSASVASASIASAPPKREPDVDLVSMLLAMGFTEDQIHAAADACGGFDRATADDLVEWILSGGQSDSNSYENEASSSAASATAANRETSSNSSRTTGLDQKQNKAAIQAKKEAEEAAKREAEVKAAAERLAAKREEQRRIRREWNNREQLRQQEEAKARLAEEVERKRRIEIEKAKITAQRVAKERAVNAAMMYQDPSSTMPIHNVQTPLPTASNSNVGATPLFPGTTFQGSAANVQNTENQYFPDMHSPNLTFGQSVMQQNSRLFPQGATNFSRPGANVTSVATATDGPGGGSKPKKSSPMNLEKHGYEFPTLGNNKPSSPNRRQRTKNKDSPNSDEGRKGSRSKGQRKLKNESPSKEKRSDQNSPPKIVASKSFDNQKGPPPGVPMPNAASYQSNPLGEIRATAKAFVPTHFTPSASPQPPSGLVNAPPMPPPGLVPSSSPAPKQMIPPQSNSSGMSSGILPPTSKPIPSYSGGTTSLLPKNSVGYDVSNATLSPSIKEPFSSSPSELLGGSNHHLPMSSPAPSTTSNIVGLAGNIEESVSIPFGASPVKTNDGLLGSKVLGNLAGTLPPSSIGSSLGILETNPNGPPLSGSTLSGPSLSGPPLSGASIWGGGSTTPPPGNLGGFSLNFGNNTVSDSGNDDQNKDSESSGLWGSSGAMNSNVGGGSIW